MAHNGTITTGNPRYNYCFTFNNYSEETETALQLWLKNKTKYAVYGHEVAPTTGTAHLQGFFSLKKKSRLSTIQTLLTNQGINMALIVANGSPRQNLTYCTKADPTNYFEWGSIEAVGQGARTDILEITQEIKEDVSLDIIAYNHPVEWVRYHRGFTSLHTILKRRHIDEDRDVTVTVYWGPGGTGKTSRAITDCQKMGLGYPYLVNCPLNKSGGIWWDNYYSQKGILIDDFYGWIAPHDLYRVLDRYVLQIPFKGGFTYAEWTHVWITSNRRIEEFYKAETYLKLDFNAYHRRFHNITRFEKEEDNYNQYVEKSDKPLNIPEEESRDIDITFSEDEHFNLSEILNTKSRKGNLICRNNLTISGKGNLI